MLIWFWAFMATGPALPSGSRYVADNRVFSVWSEAFHSLFEIPGGVPDEVASDWLRGFTVDVRLAQFEQLFFELWVGAGRDP